MKPQARCDVYVANDRLYINGTEIGNVLSMMVDKKFNAPDVLLLRLETTLLAYSPGSDPTRRDPVQPMSDPPARVADVDVDRAIRRARARQDGPKRLSALVRTTRVPSAVLVADYRTETPRLHDRFPSFYEAIKRRRQGD